MINDVNATHRCSHRSVIVRSRRENLRSKQHLNMFVEQNQGRKRINKLSSPPQFAMNAIVSE